MLGVGRCNAPSFVYAILSDVYPALCLEQRGLNQPAIATSLRDAPKSSTLIRGLVMAQFCLLGWAPAIEFLGTATGAHGYSGGI